MTEREFPEAERAELAAHGDALPDGSYPMPDCDAVRIQAERFNTAPESHKSELAALIHKRCRELSCGFTFNEEEGHIVEQDAG